MNERLEKLREWFQNKTIELGFDFFPINWEIVPEEVILEIASYGLPKKFSHWSYGQSYEYQKTQSSLGLSKIYELILNSNPSYAFLLDSNNDVESALIIAHCIFHSCFFKNNYLFKETDRKMIFHAAERAQRIDDYIHQYGIEKVEHVLDMALAMDKNIDWNRGPHRNPYPKPQKVFKSEKPSEFGDLYQESNSTKEIILNKDFPPHKEYDLLWFLANYATLDEWKKDVFEIVREESYYFYPQYMTKTLNEGLACITGDSLLLTKQGILKIEDIVEKVGLVFVSDNHSTEKVTAGVKLDPKKGYKIITKRGLKIEGACDHRIMNADGNWEYIKDLKIGSKLLTPMGQNIWSDKQFEINYKMPDYQDKNFICKKHGISYKTLSRFLNKTHKTKKENLPKIEKVLKDLNDVNVYKFGINASRRKDFKIPKVVDLDLARFLGYLVGDGHISYATRSFGLTSGDLESIEDFKYLCKKIFNLNCTIKWDDSSKNGRYRANCHSVGAMDFLTKHLGLKSGVSARIKEIPDCILKSPKNIISEYLKSYYDSDGCASSKDGVILITSSEKMSEQLQVILSNFGIASTRKLQKSDLCWRITISGYNVKIFEEEIGFGLKRKKDNLRKYISNRKKFIKRNNSIDEIVSITESHNSYYDITVENSHQYMANGFLNHNCFGHTELLFLLKDELFTPSEYLDFVKLHEKVVQPGTNKMDINPYYLGFTILGDIKKRWDEKFAKGESEINGYQKIFQVIKEEDDISFIRNHLTQDLVDQMQLFTYKIIHDRNQNQYMEIKSTQLNDVIESQVSKLYNYRAPLIYIDKASPAGLELVHESTEIGTLDPKHLRKVCEYLHEIWGGVINVKSVDENGQEYHFTFDEEGWSHID